MLWIVGQTIHWLEYVSTNKTLTCRYKNVLDLVYYKFKQTQSRTKRIVEYSNEKVSKDMFIERVHMYM